MMIEGAFISSFTGASSTFEEPAWDVLFVLVSMTHSTVTLIKTIIVHAFHDLFLENIQLLCEFSYCALL